MSPEGEFNPVAAIGVHAVYVIAISPFSGAKKDYPARPVSLTTGLIATGKASESRRKQEATSSSLTSSVVHRILPYPPSLHFACGSHSDNQNGIEMRMSLLTARDLGFLPSASTTISSNTFTGLTKIRPLPSGVQEDKPWSGSVALPS